MRLIVTYEDDSIETYEVSNYGMRDDGWLWADVEVYEPASHFNPQLVKAREHFNPKFVKSYRTIIE